MVKNDPYAEEEPPYTYECANCGNRIEADSQPGPCPECGGEMKNLSNPSGE